MAAKPAVNSVKVRMYRHGFGDCFLLSFFRDKERVFTMLIDCGIKYNTKSEDVPIEDVIADLKTTLTPEGGTHPQLDVLVISHEHWDHISYFHPTRSPDFFADFEIGQVWLAWTENPEDDEAVTINSRLRAGAAALHMAAVRLREEERAEVEQTKGLYLGGAIAAARGEFNQALDDVLGFYGVTSRKKVSESGIEYKDGEISIMTQQALEHIIKLGTRTGKVQYFSPGSTVEPGLLPRGVNVYVLGPPRSSLMNKSDPSPGAAKETYLSIDGTGFTSFIDGMLGLGAADGGLPPRDDASPFGAGVGISRDQAPADPFFQSTYFDAAEAYRKIEHSWLDIAGQFALQLDNAINNTSLVLAIELAESGKVLLFPGDAQVGNWLSWHDHEWEVTDGSTTRTRTASDLLKRTVLYKVSHHGSHNATLKGQGLELMTHPDLVALMPEKEKSYSGIPDEDLMTGLKQQCKGRVLVSADVNLPPEQVLEDRPAELSVAEWKAFKKNVVLNRVYVEYTVRS